MWCIYFQPFHSSATLFPRSSFRAVLGVAEHFGRMKSHFAQIFSALAVVRTLRWLHRKLLYLVGKFLSCHH